MPRHPTIVTLFPYTTLFRSHQAIRVVEGGDADPAGRQRARAVVLAPGQAQPGSGPDQLGLQVLGVRPAPFGHRVAQPGTDRKSTRLNSSHANISYAVFCLKK